MKANRSAALAAIGAALAASLWAAAAPAAEPGAGVPPPGAAGEAAAEADAACDPAVRSALAASAERGVEADLAIIRHPDQGIRNPDSILDFSCIGDLFDYSAFDILFDPAGALEDILDLARRRICAAARDAYRRYLGRALDPAVYAVPARRLPGLELDPRRRNVLDDIGADDAATERFRSVVGGGR